jgi:DNA-binding CsgD family transcriptional regulator
MATHAARARLSYGEWLRRENRRIDARGQRVEREPQLAAMGVQAFAERARRELLATGERVRKRDEDPGAELTPQEQEIVRLARDGRTNSEIGAQLFIGARTVEWHLRKVFTKLDIGSRRELDEALRRPGSGPKTKGPGTGPGSSTGASGRRLRNTYPC